MPPPLLKRMRQTASTETAAGPTMSNWRPIRMWQSCAYPAPSSSVRRLRSERRSTVHVSSEVDCRLLIPVMIAARYDAVTAVAVILLGAGVGVLGSTVNAFATVIASDAAGIPFTQGIVLRFVILGLSWLACALCRARAA